MEPVNKMPQNLEIECAEAARKIVERVDKKDKKELKSALNSALAVLEEQGPYAMMLYLKARHKKISANIEEPSISLLRKVFANIDKEKDSFEIFKTLAKNLDGLLFARALLNTVLGYAYYFLKAEED